MSSTLSNAAKKTIIAIVSALGAAGTALQNYIAVDLFLRGIFVGFTSISSRLSGLIQAVAIGAGGACSGVVNFFINVELLEGFFERITSNKASRELSGWRKFRYYAGIFVFSITGVLFGMMAFAFSATTPLAVLALAAGVFVAIIMTIQEVETWLQSFDEKVRILFSEPTADDKDKVTSSNEVLVIYTNSIYKLGFCNKNGQYETKEIVDKEMLACLAHYKQAGDIDTVDHLNKINTLLILLDSGSHKRSINDIFMTWKSTLTLSKLCGHIIAAGNVLALSLLFTLSLVDVLVALQVAAFPALVIGLSVAFTFGAFTEFYFYNFFLAKLCNKFTENWGKMKETHYAPLGYASIGTNAFVNGALTFAGVGLLSSVLVLAGFAVPPVGLIMGLATVSAVFSGSASFLLGMDFWIRKMTPVSAEPVNEVVIAAEQPSQVVSAANDEQLLVTPGYSFFKAVEDRPFVAMNDVVVTHDDVQSAPLLA